MTFMSWLFDIRSLAGALIIAFLYSQYKGKDIIKKKSYKVFLMAAATNFMMLAGVDLNYTLTAWTSCAIAISVGGLLAVGMVQDLMNHSASQTFDRSVPNYPLHVVTKYQDLRVPLTDLIMIFSGQTMLMALYMQDWCAPIVRPDFDNGLWICGWVAQGVAYMKFGFHLSDEIDFWRKLAAIRAVGMRCGDRVSGLTVVETEKPMPLEVDSREVVIRGVMSFIVYAVYDIFLWMTLPLYVARGRGGVELLAHLVILLYVMTLGDLARPAVLHEKLIGEDIESAAELTPGMTQ